MKCFYFILFFKLFIYLFIWGFFFWGGGLFIYHHLFGSNVAYPQSFLTLIPFQDSFSTTCFTLIACVCKRETQGDVHSGQVRGQLVHGLN